MSEFIQQSANEQTPEGVSIELRKDLLQYADFIHTEDIFHAPAELRDPQLLFGADILINRPDMNFERRFAQTPLNPNRLYTYMQPYPRILEMLLDTRLDEIFEKTKLEHPYTSAIRDEITIGFDRRYAGNDKAYKRLREAVLGDAIHQPDAELPLLEQEDADLIWRALTAGASMYDTARLLLRYPTINSIEAAKYTQPLDARAPLDMEAHIQSGLAECAGDRGLEIDLYADLNRTARNGRFIDILSDFRPKLGEELTPSQIKRREEQMALRKLIIGTKDNICSMTDGETTIELVRKQSFVAIDPTLQLPFTKPNRVSINLGVPDSEGRTEREANVQHNSTSCYWRVLPPAHL